MVIAIVSAPRDRCAQDKHMTTRVPRKTMSTRKTKRATRGSRLKSQGDQEIKSSPALGSGAPHSPFGTPKQLAGGGTKTTLVQRVHRSLLESLDEGILEPGQRIKAAELAKRLGLSRAPVREALHVLAGQGLVELLLDKGAVMRNLTLDDLIQIYEVSGAIGKIGVVAAARRIHEGDNRERVAAAIARIHAAEQAPPSYKFYLVLNDFHYVLNEIGEKPYLGFVLGILNIEYWNRFLAKTIDLKACIPGYIANYDRMASAVLAGDWRAAGAIVESHVEWSIGLLERSRPR